MTNHQNQAPAFLSVEKAATLVAYLGATMHHTPHDPSQGGRHPGGVDVMTKSRGKWSLYANNSLGERREVFANSYWVGEDGIMRLNRWGEENILKWFADSRPKDMDLTDILADDEIVAARKRCESKTYGLGYDPFFPPWTAA